MTTPNPFSVTRAVDFSDQEILKKWVDFPGAGGIADIAKPDSAMPMIILGGKGSGKTHLLRLLSTSARAAGGATPEMLRASGYLGIYLRCGGINSSRFSSKGGSEEEWAAVFRYYFDLTLAELALRDAARAIDRENTTAEHEREACLKIMSEFDVWEEPAANSIADMNAALTRLRRAIDIEVNNAALTKRIDVRISATPGRLVCGVPQALALSLPCLSRLRFTYLVDELENLSEDQQIYVNSLVRESASPSSIKVGARLYGLKTMRTLSSEEELKEGSEYERLVVDEYLRAAGDKAFRAFAAQLCVLRLRDAQFAAPGRDHDAQKWMASQFEERETSTYGDRETDFVTADSRSRPWMKRLESHLAKVLGPGRTSLVDDIVTLLCFEQHPLVERVALHVFYQEWHLYGPTRDAAGSIRKRVDAFLRNPKASPEFLQSFRHWRGDMLAHVLRDYKRPIVRSGFNDLVRLAHGLPRHLLVILKHVFSWSLFREERPFSGGIISIESQRRGIDDAAEWFFQDARIAGSDGDRLQVAVKRIAELFKAVRYSDKPSEVDVCAFSVDMTAVTEEARHILQLAEKWSLLTGKDGGRPDRNSFRVDAKYRLNPLLAVRWDLSIGLRGELQLSGDDVSTILCGDADAASEVVSRRTASMNGPYFGRRAKREEDRNIPLPGFD